MNLQLAAATMVTAAALVLASPPAWVVGLVLLVVVLPLGVVLAFRVEPGLVLALGLAGSVFSGYAGRIGLPIGPDRVLVPLALALLVCGGPLGSPDRPKLRWRAVHGWMLVTVGIVVVLGVAAGSFVGKRGFFALLDRLGIVPFLAFALAPLLFSSARQRSHLLVVLVGVGWYLGLTGLLEGFGYRDLVWPSYINDPSVGLHFFRARGPFVESSALGVSLLGSLGAAVIAMQVWRSRASKWAARLLVPVLLLAAVFTLTRAVWLAAAAAGLVGIAATPRLRRAFLPILLVSAVSVAAALALVPGLGDSVSQRRAERIAVWDRLNTNAAAIDAVRANPLTGIGWARFRDESTRYLDQQASYPLTGETIEVHNVLLSRLAEIGLLGTIPLLVTMVLGLVVPALAPTKPELRPWRLGLLIYGAAFAVVSMFGPNPGAFPNLLLWLLAGIVATPATTWGPDRDEVEVPSVAVAAV